jgi:hypothetical protein
MSCKHPVSKIQCPICSQVFDVRLISENKGVARFYCCNCCSEIHVVPSKNIMKVYKVTVMGELTDEIIVRKKIRLKLEFK